MQFANLVAVLVDCRDVPGDGMEVGAGELDDEESMRDFQ